MNKYYTTDRILSKKADYYISIGNRCNGKTTAWNIELIDNFFKTGKGFGRIMRSAIIGGDDIYQSWFTDYAQQYLLEKYNHRIEVINHTYYLVDNDDEYLELEKGQRRPRLKLKLFGKVFSLMQEVKYKSSEYKWIGILIFEEFTLMEQWAYLDNEVEHFLSLLSTINRNRTDLYVVFIGNTISKYNPYFNLLGININKLKLKQGDIVDLQDKSFKNGARIRIEFAESIYTNDEEAPRVLQVGGNDIAVTGDYTVTQYVVDKEYDDWINGLDNYIIGVVRYNNKNYYILKCSHKKTDFIFITSRCKQYKCNKIYGIDTTVIECIKCGYLSRKELLKDLQEYIFLNFLYSDEDIEYKMNELFINKK